MKKVKERGSIVETKFGRGRTKDKDDMVFGKIPVYLDDGGRFYVYRPILRL